MPVARNETVAQTPFDIGREDYLHGRKCNSAKCALRYEQLDYEVGYHTEQHDLDFILPHYTKLGGTDGSGLL